MTEDARVADGVRIYAIGDVHGRADLLDHVFSRIDADLVRYPARNPVHVLLGDYIDRGPQSKQVIDRLVARCRTHKTICLKGNHEAFVVEFLDHSAALDAWSRNGGLDTLISYGVVPATKREASEAAKIAAELGQAMPTAHRRFLANLQPYYICGDFFFVHAGVRPGTALAEQSESDLYWIRDDFLQYEDSYGKVVVHGHTPVRQPEVRPNRINIDTGAYATGNLTCLVLEGNELLFI